MGTKKAASPGIGGAISDAVEAVKSYAGFGKRNITGSPDEDRQLSDTEEAESHSSTQASASRAAQSTDKDNQY
jgi:hypothetical protein